MERPPSTRPCARPLHTLLLLNSLHGVYLLVKVPRRLQSVPGTRSYVRAFFDPCVGVVAAAARKEGKD